MTRTRRLGMLLAVLAVTGGVAACGDSGSSDESAGSLANGGGGGSNTGGKTSAANTRQDGGGGPDSEAEQKKDEKIVDEQPSTDNEVLLGASFFGEQPADFGVVKLAATRTMSFTVKNLVQPRTILGTSLAGDHASDFSIDPGTCDGATLNAGDSCTLLITFAPTAEGERLAELQVALDPGVGAGRSLRGGASSTPAPPPLVTNTAPQPTSTSESGGINEPTGEGDGAGAAATTTAP